MRQAADGTHSISEAGEVITMSMPDHQGSTPDNHQILDMQSALFELRDRLMNLKMSLQDLSCLHDEQAQRQASLEMNALLARLRT